MGHIDNRVRYTKMILQQALLEILGKKSISKVTIKELCETAKVNRGTFYLHYDTPNDLLMEIEQQFIDENMVFSMLFFESKNEVGYLARLFESIIRNKELCRVIMGKNGNPRFLDHIEELIRPSVMENWSREFPDYSRVDLEFTFSYVFSGSMHLILSWIEDDHGITTQELAVRLERLGHHGLMAVNEFYGKG